MSIVLNELNRNASSGMASTFSPLRRADSVLIVSLSSISIFSPEGVRTSAATISVLLSGSFSNGGLYEKNAHTVGINRTIIKTAAKNLFFTAIPFLSLIKTL